MTILINPRHDGPRRHTSEPRGAPLQTALLMSAVVALLVLVAVLGWNQYRPAEQAYPKIVITTDDSSRPGGPDAR